MSLEHCLTQNLWTFHFRIIQKSLGSQSAVGDGVSVLREKLEILRTVSLPTIETESALNL